MSMKASKANPTKVRTRTTKVNPAAHWSRMESLGEWPYCFGGEYGLLMISQITSVITEPERAIIHFLNHAQVLLRVHHIVIRVFLVELRRPLRSVLIRQPIGQRPAPTAFRWSHMLEQPPVLRIVSWIPMNYLMPLHDPPIR